MKFIVPVVSVIHALCTIAEHSGTIQYANIGESIILTCEQKKGAENLRWRRDNSFLTDGQQINKKISWYRKLTIQFETDVNQYNLRIANVTTDDLGLYVCEMQINKEIFRQRITLKYEEFQTLSTSNPVSSLFHDETTEFQTLSTSNPVSGIFHEGKTEATFQVNETTKRSIQSTLSDTENIVPMNNQMYSYGFFAAGFVVVLLVSIGCNICISNYRNRTIRQQVGQQTNAIKNPNSGDDNIQESVSIGELSNVSSKYETINENDIAIRNSTNNEHRNQTQTKNKKCSPLFDQSYLDVIGDDVKSASDPEKIKSCLSDTSSTSNIKKEKTAVQNTDTCTDDELASCSSMEAKCFEEAENSTTSNSSIHLKICSLSKLVEREVNSIKKMDTMNTYLTLNTSDMDYCHSYFTAVAPDLEFKSVFKQEKQLFVQQKRHSCP